MSKRWLAPSNTVKATLRIAASLLVFLSVSIQVEAKSYYEQESSVNKPILLEKGDNQTLARRPLHGLRRRVEEGLRRGNKPIVVGTPERLRRVLDSIRPRRIKVDSTEFSLDRNSWRHILTRHHREYWDGTTRTRQSFFRKNMTVTEIEEAMIDVINQNRKRLSRLGGNRLDTVEGVVNGIKYVLRVEKGRIGSFYPKSQ
jgi:hypothetical protein